MIVKRPTPCGTEQTLAITPWQVWTWTQTVPLEAPLHGADFHPHRKAREGQRTASTPAQASVSSWGLFCTPLPSIYRGNELARDQGPSFLASISVDCLQTLSPELSSFPGPVHPDTSIPNSCFPTAHSPTGTPALESQGWLSGDSISIENRTL